MTTLRTAARLTIAVLAIGLGAALAPAADHKPIKPAALPVVKLPNGFSFGCAGGGREMVKSRDAASGLPTGRTKPTYWMGDTATHEVGHLKGPTVAPKGGKK